MCFVLGCFTAVETPVRQSFVAEMVGRAQMTNAIALNSMTFNMSRIVGPAIAGFLITWIGTGWLFFVNAASTLGVITGLIMMNPDLLFRGPAVRRARGQLREGVRYAAGRPEILTVLILMAFVSTFGVTFYTSLAIMAANVFHMRADGYGLLSTMLAIGTLSGALLAARRSTRTRPTPRLVLRAAFLFGVLEFVSGLMPTYIAFGLALVPLGVAAMTMMNSANTTVQLSASPEMRGRVMGLYMFIFFGGNPIGGPLSGWLAAELGGRSPLLIGGAVAALAAVGCALLYRRLSAR